jgi:flagellar biosynthesis protein FliR
VPFQLHTATLVTLLLVTARIFAWSAVAPPMATGGVPMRIRTVVSVALALPLLPIAQSHAPPAQTAPLVSALVIQVVIGAALGFLTRLLFTAIEAAGSLIDVGANFSLAAAYDPMAGASNGAFGRFYSLLCTTLIFATNVHLLIFAGFLRTFSAVPLDAGVSLSRLDRVITSGVSEMFVAALQIAGPLLVVLFVADLALGLLNRIAPQLNAFAMSFPLKIGLTLLLVGFTFLLLPQTIIQIGGRATRLVLGVVS